MGRLTFKKYFEFYRPMEETTTVCVNGYTQVIEPVEYDSDGNCLRQNYYIVGEAVDKLAKCEDAEEQGLLVPVVHGRWVHTEEGVGWYIDEVAKCSVCQDSFVLGEMDFDDVVDNFNFCPNCGAKMDLEEE